MHLVEALVQWLQVMQQLGNPATPLLHHHTLAANSSYALGQKLGLIESPLCKQWYCPAASYADPDHVYAQPLQNLLLLQLQSKPGAGADCQAATRARP
jgi:hypothetical protein